MQTKIRNTYPCDFEAKGRLLELCFLFLVSCMLIDPNGYVVYSKQFMTNPR